MAFQKPAASRCGLFLSCLLFLFAPGVAEAARLSIFGVGTSSNMNYYSSSGGALTSPTQSQIGYGGGLELEFHLGSRVGLELGAAYLNRKVLDTTVNPSLGSTYAFLHVPLQFRLHLAHFLSLSAGGYASEAIGTISDSSGGSTSYSSAGYNKLEYGVVGGARIDFFHGSGPFVEGRYIYGLSDMIDHSVADGIDPALASQRARWREIQILVGLRLGGR
jgi:hypothetical protein